ncbi:hypothetical protein XSR1_670009 [Xenorhabdus szentirmaii DSM 16338]|uniref:Uncharacterized protein n=1 Tax=Xenorhabdus szentirmaii DSM 16338 TaxID=1427518 RepID=W1J574_9GAMM|nr:hypothetical protein XSR1_670009 [Xenorhabdus szentirmaii DSM 16338]
MSSRLPLCQRTLKSKGHKIQKQPINAIYLCDLTLFRANRELAFLYYFHK